ncbi:RHS repeat-associated core domain-containing protein [Amycolatopsis sp. QT-25]|uniref:RHS repeat-associated core domain-containing protein n=1 Tax=Amycolatopsis sp. QT-25 TaxID=3034022 RepID=UPI0023ED97F4|nr:RHS repeat-associated core domain-containing protein [Amycolatopsis sp. QT-25]WET79006.1 RHS repeat-associated core domain-containing protein [Amycolatopsis sp. QT-25]
MREDFLIMQRKLLRRFVLRVISATTAVVLVAAIPVSASAATGIAGGVPLPVTWTPPTQVNRTPTGVPADQVTAKLEEATPGSRPSITSANCATGARLGTQPWFPMDRYAISDRTELLVNRANGNAVITDRAVTVKGTGLDLSVNAVYNSRGIAGAFGKQWTVSSGPDVRLILGTAGAVVVQDPTGYCSEYRQNPDGSYATPIGGHATLVKLADGKYTLSQHSSGETWSFTGAGRLISQADRNGHALTYRYNATDGTLASITDTQGRVTTAVTNADGRISAITDPSGLVAGGYAYAQPGPGGRLASITNRNDGKTTFTQDEMGRVTSVTPPGGGTYVLAYDSVGRVTQVKEPDSDGVPSITDYAYGDTTTTVTNPNRHKTTYTIDDKQRQIKATDALGHTRAQSWSANGDVASLTDGMNNSVTYDYDALNNLKGGKLPTSATASVGYTDTAHPRLPTQVSDFSGTKVTKSYDSNGNVKAVRADGLGADVAKYTYTATGLVATKADGNGNITRYGYDNAGNLTTVIPPTPLKPTTYTYDSLSRVTSVTDGSGVTINYGYDKLDHIVAVSAADGTGLAAYGFDGIGNRTTARTAQADFTSTFNRQLLAKVTRTAGGNIQATIYSHDRGGNVTGVEDPSGRTLYGYDAADRLTSLTDQAGKVTTYGYDTAGNRTSASLPGGSTQTIEVDASGRQKAIALKNSAGATLFSSTYRYTRADGTDTGQIQSRTDSTGTAANTYDGFGRLTKAGTRGYAYDLAGNLTSGDGRTYTVNTANQMTKVDTTTATYDGAGNLSTTTPGGHAHYSPTNQLTSITSGTDTLFTASYDTLDQTQPNAITETTDTAEGTTTTSHAFTRTALGVSRTVVNGATTTYTHDTDGKLTAVTDTAGQHHNAITDDQGSVLALVNDTGQVTARYDYTPYGTTTATYLSGSGAEANRVRWIGTYRLTSGISLTGSRHYNPVYSRFTQPDPTGQEDNIYAYAQGDPVNASDPSGTKASKGCTGAGVAAIFGLVGAAAAVAGAGATGGALVPVAIQTSITATGAITGAAIACS